MKTRIAVSCCLVAVMLVVGCGPRSAGKLGPMSGKLSLDGKPMPGVEIVFSPMATADNGSPGPYSTSVTDEDGNYELKTRYGETGAIVGKHNVTMAYADMEPGAMDELRSELSELKNSREEGDKEAAADVLVQMEALKKKMKGRMIIPSSADSEYEVRPGGNKNANFELVSD